MSEEWQYYDSTTIKINGDLTSKYWENQVVTITQSNQTKYFEIISVELSSGDTLLHLNGGGLYTLTNDTITSHYYSMYAAPQGLPNVFTRNILYRYIPHSLATAENDFLVASGSGTFTKKTLAETKNVLGINGCVPIDGWIPAGETWTYDEEDDPTFTFKIEGDKTTKYYPGMRIKLTQSTTKYFIIVKVNYSDPDTTITVYGGTDYNLSGDEITNPFYSMMKAPAGFPLSPDKWTVKLVNSDLKDQLNPVALTWYNVGGLSLTIPIGVWRVYYFSDSQVGNFSSATQFTLSTTLSTTNNDESDNEFTVMSYVNSAIMLVAPATKEKILNLASKTTYYLNLNTGYWGDSVPGHLYINGEQATTIIFAVCAYL